MEEKINQEAQEPELRLKDNHHDLQTRYRVDGLVLRDDARDGETVIQCRPGHTYDL